MKPNWKFAMILAQLFCLLFMFCGCEYNGCGGSPLPEQTNAPEDMQTAPERTAAAVCMGSVNHPVHRIVQLGFMEKAEELGYEGHILGLDAGSMQELYDCWLEGAKEHDIAGAVCWVGDDSSYEFLKELHGMGVKTVVPHFQHTYTATKDFIDVNLYADMDRTLFDMGDYLVQRLREKGIFSGGLGFTVNGPGPIYEEVTEYENYMKQTYPEYSIIERRAEGAEVNEAARIVTSYIQSNPDMVGAIGRTGGSALSWSTAMERTGRDDIVVVAMDYTIDNLDILTAGKVDALVASPLYEEGYLGLALIDNMMHGRVYNLSEGLWWQELDNCIIRKDGEDITGPAYYYDLFTRAQTRFGPAASLDSIG